MHEMTGLSSQRPPKWPILHQIEVLDPKMYFSEYLNRSNPLYVEVPTNPPLTTFPMT